MDGLRYWKEILQVSSDQRTFAKKRFYFYALYLKQKEQNNLLMVQFSPS